MPILAIQMDPLESINPRSDTTLLLGQEAERRGYRIYHYHPCGLAWREGGVTAQARRVAFPADASGYYQWLGEEEALDLAEADVVLMRQDPPFNMEYITATYLLQQLPAATKVVNDPGAVRDYPEKLFPLLFQEYMPPTLVTADSAAIRDFRREHNEIVLKPLYGYGGKSVFYFKEKDSNIDVLLELWNGREPLVAQPFLPEVATQDRRIILINGKISGAFGRIPAQGEVRANMRVGGEAVAAELTPCQRQCCERIGGELKKLGILLAGVDMIGDWLTEINVTSPTGLRTLQNLYGAAPEREFWEAVEGMMNG